MARILLCTGEGGGCCCPDTGIQAQPHLSGDTRPAGRPHAAPELSTDLLSSQITAQAPVPAVQNQFRNLLRSLEQADEEKLQGPAGSKASIKA